MRFSDFARYAKNNTAGDKKVFYKELLTAKKKESQHMLRIKSENTF